MPGETVETACQEVEDTLRKFRDEVSGFQYELRANFSPSTFEIEREHPFVSMVAHHAKNTTSMELAFLAEPFWTDCVLLSCTGIPVAVYRPKSRVFMQGQDMSILPLHSIRYIVGTFQAYSLPETGLSRSSFPKEQCADAQSTSPAYLGTTPHMSGSNSDVPSGT